ncbi:MAG TPA: Gfo/Idh/MocA family oxidoreductase [Thermoguttaceae bacterium]|nr:Gfo/Idh/MocA family oxidoreductase [Thermoguttaceae bacterium]
MRKRTVHRREFLTASAQAAVALSIIPEGLAFGATANEKLNIALVGIGGRGTWFVDTIPRTGQNVVAVCDVNDDRAAESLKKMAGVPRYYDYRKMLSEKDKEIDAVIVATPDHHHAPCGVRAMKMGKHLYCEKPLTNSINEARTMRRVAKETGVATQMGNQGTATGAFREQVEIIQSGDLGEIRDVYVWNTNAGVGNIKLPTDSMPVPETLKWDLWLGPRKMRPYHREWMKWHNLREFGTQQLGNWAIHSSNMQFMGLRLNSLWYADPTKGPTPKIRVRAEVSEIVRDTFPKWEKIDWEFPARGNMPPVTVHWMAGMNQPGFRETLEPLLGRKLIAGGPGPWLDYAGCLVVGTKGKIHSTGHNSTYTLLPEKQFADYKLPEPTLPRLGSHEREWFEACRGGPAAMSNFDYGAVLTEFVLLGNLATQFDRTIEYDPVAMKCIGDEEADAALRRDHREGWSV